MGTAIEWTDETWNPVTGCTKVSPGCDNCYAERVTERFSGKGSFTEVVLHPDRLDKPLHWRKPRKVFVNSMSDLFHEDVPDEFIAEVFGVMAATPRHTFQLLTKRHGRLRSLLSDPAFPVAVEYAVRTRWARMTRAESARDPLRWVWDGQGAMPWPLPNVWLGVSVETQQWADIRIPALLDTPAAVRFLSCEPLLGPINFRWAKWVPLVNGWHLDGLNALDWVIVGGESGPGARPMVAEWARTIRDQCEGAGVPFLFKQWGGRTPKAGGRLLDGRLHDGYPDPVPIPA